MCDRLMDFAETEVAPVFAESGEATAIVDDDPPPAGTACAGCKGLGHWCPAKVYRGIDTALCRACAEGVDCSVVRVRLQRVDEDFMPAMKRESCAASEVRDVTPLDAKSRVIPPSREEVRRNYAGFAIGSGGPAFRVGEKARESAARGALAGRQSHFKGAVKYERCEQAAPPIENALDDPQVDVEAKEEVEMGRLFKVAVTKEMQEAIRVANPTEGAKSLAERLGIEVRLIYYWRDKFKKAMAKPAPKQARPEKPQTVAMQRAEYSGVPIDMEDVGPRVMSLATPLPVTIEGGAVSVEAARIDAWFQKLPLDRKAELFFAEVGL